ncbi:BgTH12-01140 [Blumeria graminis f. sp. triticale]|uniref:BgtA-20423 n=3 Tax=Blumeria graminis TaxID=34373 RepID=A0A9X9MN29_BLUGR|nr:hypothetical protein BGT96224_A20423 [Blumeria graminis f. sp. tritici 96224]CAD6505650.1 BgTH12-01140 [Blumeria graminis f. sp. triticale]VDB93794.1 BgtA-20423 [Blumeria graminis f. sp. tritici]
MSLPEPHVFLTSIFDTLTELVAEPSDSAKGKATSSNPLASLPPSRQAILITLHALFPPPMLLQALDLLDRGLVTRIVLTSHHVSREQDDPHALQQPAISNTNLSADSPNVMHHNPALEIKVRSGSIGGMYQVCSTQPKKRAPKRSSYRNTSSSAEKYYTVYLTAWNCSCADFTFSLFPALLVDSVSSKNSKNDIEDAKVDNESVEWEFGGVRRKNATETVPICKHLIACLIGERWGKLLGSYVKERQVNREEMAGIASDYR